MDISETLTPKSDQLNADDLIAGELFVTISEVSAGSAEQPVFIHTAEFPGRPFKPCKTVRRLLAAAWGTETNVWIGRRLQLYRDPTVTYGKDEVGGIRVKAMSHIQRRITLPLTVRRGSRKQFSVDPLPDQPSNDKRSKWLSGCVKKLADAGCDKPEDQVKFLSEVVKRKLSSVSDLTDAEMESVSKELRAVTDLPLFIVDNLNAADLREQS